MLRASSSPFRSLSRSSLGLLSPDPSSFRSSPFFLDQIAAGREGGKREEPSSRQTEKEGLQRAKKEMKPEDLKLLGDILQEYLT